ncbi:response regulator transcription factor [Actinomadura sp. DC4]|uniref:response regulator transcription factor n=1 Tax=Actinomadura sp. DC4 TaxID=3055069 RepID=UPI0025B05D3E|nr:response regulator transcription factor [Actinomadura sp. DC4]MDN3357536.1 response regulator transcription factor [Actinomadura sp. DC4]
MTVRVALADDQSLVRAGFRVLVNSAPDLEVVGEAANGQEIVALTRETKPDVVLMDVRMPDMDGLAATRQITADETLAAVRVLVLTTFEIDEYVFAALRAGASGFLGKGVEAEELQEAIRVIARGEALLSPVATRGLIARFLSGTLEMTDHADERLAALTDRERDVMIMVAAGRTNDEIAERLRISPFTAKTHVNRAMTKVGAHDRAQLVIMAYETGLVRPAGHSAQ